MRASATRHVECIHTARCLTVASANWRGRVRRCDCYPALDDAGVLTTKAPAGGNWTTIELPTPPECSDHMCFPTDLESICCPTASFCAATDATAQLWTTSDPGGPASAWTESTLPKVSSDGGPR